MTRDGAAAYAGRDAALPRTTPMLDSLTIRNFRLFEELTIERLGRVNLIVGRNNSGKSCLLEAVELFISFFNPLNALEILERRGEYNPPRTDRNDRNTRPISFEQHPTRYFFHNSDPLNSIELAGTVNSNIIHFSIGLAHYSFSATGFQRLSRPSFTTPSINNLIYKQCLEISEKINDDPLDPRPLLPVDVDFATTISLSGAPTQINITCVPSTGLSEEAFGKLWNKVALHPIESLVKESLSSAFPEVIDVTVVFDPEKNDFSIKIKNQNNLITDIRSLGDGVRRFYGILLSAANMQNGFLLIDEIENGLHWTIQEKMWRALFHIASSLNAQIFVTTHSQDAINAFESVWRDNESTGAFHRLERHPRTGKIIASTYTLDTLSASVETDFEVR